MKDWSDMDDREVEMVATDSELRRLQALVSQHNLDAQMRGELVFGAIDDEGRPDVATPFFGDAEYAELKAGGLRDALIGMLDDMMVERSAQGAERAYDGILRLGSGKAVLDGCPKAPPVMRPMRAAMTGI